MFFYVWKCISFCIVLTFHLYINFLNKIVWKCISLKNLSNSTMWCLNKILHQIYVQCYSCQHRKKKTHDTNKICFTIEHLSYTFINRASWNYLHHQSPARRILYICVLHAALCSLFICFVISMRFVSGDILFKRCNIMWSLSAMFSVPAGKYITGRISVLDKKKY